jgi:CubicO group peptidase (beta-lactamase class C family)
MSRLKLSLLILFFAAFNIAVIAQPLTSPQIDALVEKTLTTFNVPGIAVAIVKDGKIIHLKGYGVRSLRTMQKVDEHTLFGIASNSKAFTSAALGMLIDEGKLKWTDRVTDYIPGFKLYNPYVTQNFTIADLLSHRSGLGLGAGDLMMWPDGTSFTKNDIIHNLRFLKPISDFRTKFDYDNLLYIVAGEVVAKVSGMSWEDFIENKIMKPLQMNESAASINRVKDKSNVIDPHAPVNGKLEVLNINWSETANAAGGIYSNITDMSKWAMLQMNNGKYGDGLQKHLFSEKVHEDMWEPHTIISVPNKGPYNTHFKSYGLGWFLSDEMGYKVPTHTGGLAGIVTQVTLIPELQLAIIVLTNQQAGAAFVTITNSIKDAYFGIKGKDRLQEYSERVKAGEKYAKEVTDKLWKDIAAIQSANSQKIIDSIYTGTYNDPWFGDVTISVKNNKLWFDSKRSKRLTGEMLFYKGNTFIVKWDDRSLDADAFVLFGLNQNGIGNSIKMEAISPMTDFSFDFQDLDFTRVP